MSSLKTRPERPTRDDVSADMPSFASLGQTHREMLEMLARLHILVEQIEVRGTDDGVRRVARDVCRFFDDTARLHHAEEEQLVFASLLIGGDAGLVQHVKRLQQDHGWLEEDWRELSRHLHAVAEGQSGYDVSVLRSAVPAFSELYRDHIAVEETIVYPASRRRRTEPSRRVPAIG